MGKRIELFSWFLVFIFFNLFVLSSCGSLFTSEGGIAYKTEKITVNPVNNEKQKGRILTSNQRSEENDIVLTDFTYIRFGSLLSDEDYVCTKGIISYKNKNIYPVLKYRFYVFHNEQEKKYGYFRFLEICNMPPEYSFEKYKEKYPLKSFFEAVYIQEDQMPASFIEFFIDAEKYKLVITKLDKWQYGIITTGFLQSQNYNTLRVMIANPSQEFWIVNENGDLCAKFSADNYVVFDVCEDIVEKMLPVIGLYSGLFRLLNSRYYDWLPERNGS